MHIKNIMIFGLILTSQIGVAIDQKNEKLTITEILAAVEAFSHEYRKEEYYNSYDFVLYYGCNDEFHELSKQIVNDLRTFHDQDKPLNTICTPEQAHGIEWRIRESQMDTGGDNDVSSCIQDIFFESYNKKSDPEYKRTVRQLLSQYDACVKKHSANKSTYYNYKYNYNNVGLPEDDDVRDPQAKKNFNEAREKYKKRFNK